jgi:hypothetical protein
MATLFGVDEFFRKQDFRVNPRRVVPGKSEYDHWFGGPIGDVAFDLARAPLHVLFNFDLSDPLLSFLQIDAKRLPLVFPITVDGGEIAYAVRPDGGIKLFGKPPGRRAKDWPYAGYPAAFEKVPVRVLELTYEEYRAALFSYQIGPAHWLRQDDRKILEDLGSSFTQLGGVQKKPFGDPFDRSCPDPKCKLHDSSLATDIFMGIHDEPIPGMSVWDANGEGFIAFSLCRECKAIRAQTMID